MSVHLLGAIGFHHISIMRPGFDPVRLYTGDLDLNMTVAQLEDLIGQRYPEYQVQYMVTAGGPQGAEKLDNYEKTLQEYGFTKQNIITTGLYVGLSLPSKPKRPIQ